MESNLSDHQEKKQNATTNDNIATNPFVFDSENGLRNRNQRMKERNRNIGTHIHQNSPRYLTRTQLVCFIYDNVASSFFDTVGFFLSASFGFFFVAFVWVFRCDSFLYHYFVLEIMWSNA